MKWTEGKGVGTYKVTLPEKVKFEFKTVADTIHRRYCIDLMTVAIQGVVSRDDQGLWLTTPGSKLLLVNRPKKDEKDVPPDLVGKIDGALKAGVKDFRIEGEAWRVKTDTTVRLAVAEPVEKK